jgi:deoxyribonuclease-4
MIRVRAALSDSDFSRKLRGKIPKAALTVPDCSPGKYPCTLLKALPANESYKFLGIITESLLQKKNIDMETLVDAVKKDAHIDLPDNVLKGVLKAKTTQRYLDSVKVTSENLKAIIGSAPRYNPSISMDGCSIVGHPDIIAGPHIFEIKTTGQLKQGWTQFLLQTFSYAALYPSATHIHVVLPLQEYIWTWNIKDDWPKRNLFVDVMKAIHPPKTTENIQKAQDDALRDAIFGPMIFNTFPIGCHIAKRKTVQATIENMPSYRRPYQIFLTKSVEFRVSDEDITASRDLISQTGAKMFIHSPYLLNLCMEPGGPGQENNYVVESLRSHLSTAAAMGSRGVVVHVGKACKLEKQKALANMRENIIRVLDAATPECPLLLETPAGQGTETLTTMEEFMGFVTSIVDPRFGVCVDTCHIFAAGIQPVDYLKSMVANDTWKPYLKLIHFNDSKTACGSCVDRHAPLGRGLIAKEQLVECAFIATDNNIPMLVE